MHTGDGYDVAVFGLGYIGLPTSAAIAAAGFRVLGVDINQSVVDTVKRGEIHIEEADLSELVADVVARKHLTASLTPSPAKVHVIAVPTPLTADLQPECRYVFSAATAIARVLREGDLVLVESTCPVGTTAAVGALIGRLRPDLRVPANDVAGSFHLAYCPERVLPGRILVELLENDRSIGGMSPDCAAAAAEFYRRFVRGSCVQTTAATAELVKLSENAFRDVNIAFANELSLVADEVGVDVWSVIDLANRHPRVNILSPGPGVGGHCIAVDPWFLVDSLPERTPLIRTARQVNDAKAEYVLEHAEALLARHPDATIACLGLAFKANIDDLRESPALQIASELYARHGNRVVVVEPNIERLPDCLEGCELLEPLVAVERSDILLLLVDHREFTSLVPHLRDKEIYDTRGIWRHAPGREVPH